LKGAAARRRKGKRMEEAQKNGQFKFGQEVWIVDPWPEWCGITSRHADAVYNEQIRVQRLVFLSEVKYSPSERGGECPPVKELRLGTHLGHVINVAVDRVFADPVMATEKALDAIRGKVNELDHLLQRYKQIAVETRQGGEP